MSQQTSNTSGRIEGLDGLRAFAVLSVLAFHLWPTIVPGGFLGVDVFFVISGFLITTLLVRERNKVGRINLKGFWTRRARRLLPALVLVVVTSIAAARLVSGELLINIQRQTLGALTFNFNWVEIFAGTDYFNDAARSLFVPFWSLAVEEQFYLFWPLLLIGLAALTSSIGLRSIIALTAAATSASLMALLLDPASPTYVYYGTHTHSFGLMIGVALAFAFDGASRLLAGPRWQIIRAGAGFLALAGLFILFFTIDSSSPSTYPGGILLASVLTAVTVGVLPGSLTIFTSLCQIRPLAWVGERSYGMYLWHWPVLMIAGAAMPASNAGAGPGWMTVVVVILLTFLLSEASFRWLETRVRRDGFIASWRALRGAFSRPASRLFLPVTAAAVAALVLVIAGVGLMTAPDKSQEQLAIEAGQKAIAERSAADPSRTAGPAQNAVNNGPKGLAISDQGPAWPREMDVPTGEYIVGLGDSVMSGAAPAIYKLFPDIYIDAKPILQWHDARTIVHDMINSGKMRRVVILNFGTNAGFKDPASEQDLRDILNELGPGRRVVLVNVVGVSYWVPSTNATLRSISSEYPNTIVADWNAVIQKRPELLHRDHTHPNEAGIEVYASLLASTLKDLGPG